MKNLDLSFLSLSHKYLHTSKMIFIELKISGNKWIIIKDTGITGEVLEEETKRSDYNVLIPGLFLFYHGLELLIKGLLLLKDIKVKGHGIENLYSVFSTEFINEKKLNLAIRKYAYINNSDSSELIKRFVGENREINSTKRLYQAFRYPVNSDMVDEDNYDYSPILYREEDIIETIEEIIYDINNILKSSKTFSLILISTITWLRITY